MDKKSSTELNKTVWDIIQSDVKNNISSRDTSMKIDSLFKKNCSKYQYKQLLYRKDERDWRRFFLDIKKGTDAELKMLTKWKEDMVSRGKTIRGKHNGIDNTGLPVIFAQELGRPDYWLKIDDGEWFLVDLKNNPRTNEFMTFKVSDLKRYEKKESSMLIIMPLNWVMIGPNFMRGMLKDWQRNIYNNFAPGKEAIRIHRNQYDRLVSLGAMLNHEWGDMKEFKPLQDNCITREKFVEGI